MWRDGAWRDRGWRPERPTGIADALQALIDELEDRYLDTVVLPPDPLPLASGLPALDHVCGGGLRLGTATIVEADEPAQGRALLCTVARRIAHPTLLVAADPVEVSTRWVLSGATTVPEVLLRQGLLAAGDWSVIAGQLAALAERPLQLGQARSVHAVEALVRAAEATVLLLGPLDDLGEPCDVVHALDLLASRTGVAILATCSPLPELVREPSAPGCISMAAHGLAGRAALVGLDEHDGLITAQIEVDILAAGVR